MGWESRNHRRDKDGEMKDKGFIGATVHIFVSAVKVRNGI